MKFFCKIKTVPYFFRHQFKWSQSGIRGIRNRTSFPEPGKVGRIICVQIVRTCGTILALAPRGLKISIASHRIWPSLLLRIKNGGNRIGAIRMDFDGSFPPYSDRSLFRFQIPRRQQRRVPLTPDREFSNCSQRGGALPSDSISRPNPRFLQKI